MVYNRTEGNLGNRLRVFTLKVLDSGATSSSRRTSCQRRPKAARHRSSSAAAARERDPPGGHEGPDQRPRPGGRDVQGHLPKFVKDDRDRPAAVQALQRIPANHWPKEEARPLLDSLLAYIRKLPTQERKH